MNGTISRLLRNSIKFNPPRALVSTHFGYQTVNETEKQAKVDQVFHGVARKYDLMNDAMSFGVHRFWKNFFVDKIYPTSDLSFLDVAGGTGDIALRIAKLSETSSKHSQPMPRITVCDINESMIEVGKEKERALGFNSIEWVQGNAENLPFENEQFNVYTIAFGIRNCTHIEKVLQEAYRVLKPTGRFYCLEFSYVENPLLRCMYDVYSMQAIPVIGKLIAGDWKSYRYLVESIRRFPNQQDFAYMLEDVGFQKVNWVNYTFGVAAVHMGVK